MNKLRKIQFQEKKSAQLGKLSVVHVHDDLPFEIKRFFWIYDVEAGSIRGQHAHYSSHQIIVCISGSLEIRLTDLDGNQQKHVLNQANTGLLIPPMIWHEMEFGKNTIVQVFASTIYDENDYIRDFELFNSLK